MKNAKFTVRNRSAQRFAPLEAIEFTPLDESDEELGDDLNEEYYEEGDVEELDEYDEEEAEEEEVTAEELEYEEVIAEPPVRRRGRPRKTPALPQRRVAAKSSKSSGVPRLDDDLAALLLGATPPKSGGSRLSLARNEPKSPAAGSVYALASDRTMPAFDSAPKTYQPLPAEVKKRSAPRRGGWFRFCFKTFLVGGFTALACWSAYGVSLESNLPFWRETLQNSWGRFAGILFEQVHELLGLIIIG